MNMRGYRQIDLVKDCGIARQKISQYCSGRCVPNTLTLDKIAKYLNVSSAYLIGNDSKEIVEATEEVMKNQVLGVGYRRILFEYLKDKDEDFIERLLNIAKLINK